MRSTNCWLIGPLLAFLTALFSSSSPGEEFRIETEVFAGKGKEPVSRNLTLFTGGLVYDFLLTAPEEVTVFDPPRARFLLLDASRRVKTEVTVDQVERFVTALQSRATQNGELLAELARPRFEVNYEENASELHLKGEKLSYRVAVEPISDKDSAGVYALFVNRYAQLTATRPGSLPPGARLALNDALAERNLMPRKVERRFGNNNRWWGREEVVRSEHLVNYRLLPTDRQRIESVGNMVAEFDTVDFATFRGLDKLSRRD